jgi:predicted amidophosphoribosyltransferase
MMLDAVALSDLYTNVLVAPRRGRDVCVDCFNLVDGHERCAACTHSPRCLAAMSAVSYCMSGGQLHHALAGYKRLPPPSAQRLSLVLAAVLARHLNAHEHCLAAAVGTESFQLVTSVPTRHGPRDSLETMLKTLVAPIAERYRPMLSTGDTDVPAHRFSARRYRATSGLRGQSVLLIDDTWTTGASAQSAAAALATAGAGPIGALVIGRFINRRWHHNEARLQALARRYDWTRCPWCAT